MQIVEISVTNLFGIFNHKLNLKIKEGVTIVLGPNGFGKTTMLKMLQAVFNINFKYFSDVHFSEFCIIFESGTKLIVSKSEYSKEEQIEKLVDPAHKQNIFTKKIISLDIRLVEQNDVSCNFILNYPDYNEMVRAIKPQQMGRLLPELFRLGPNMWRNRVTREVLSLEDVFKVYKNELKKRVFNEFEAEEQIDSSLLEFLHNIRVHYIDTKRLNNVPVDLNEDYGENLYSFISTVDLYSENIKSIISDSINEQNKITQNLDRSYPLRLIDKLNEYRYTEEELIKLQKQVETKRNRLINAGLYEDFETDGQALLPKQTDDIVRTVLAVHAQDELEKLQVLDDLLSKIEILRDIINDRFLYKTLIIDKSEGFLFRGASENFISPSDLSSGEQHELVLFYELLFRVQKNSFVLIDEPELSLHVAWQRKFIDDIKRIAKINGFHAVIATHSPSIIDDQWDLAVELVGEDL
jgi:predicted ATP-binding protein involved in virulence